MKGTVFDIKEFSVYDGPGTRVTVFLKGCPLRCRWCHNPEGLSPHPQIMLSYNSCTDCGACRVDGCPLTGSKENFFSGVKSCSGCAECVPLCPDALRKIAGKEYEPEELLARIMKYKAFISDGGGVTFSGGEPTMQSGFLIRMLELLPFHRAVQTCGHCDPETFRRVLSRVDMLFFDIKHTDSAKHKEYTGVGNELILENLRAVKASGVPFVARVPLIAGVNDDEVNLRATAALLADAPALERVELLPFNGAAGAKYRMTGKSFDEDFHAPVTVDLTPFCEFGIKNVKYKL